MGDGFSTIISFTIDIIFSYHFLENMLNWL